MKNILPIILTAGGIYLAFRMFRKAQTAKTLNVKLRNVNLTPISKASLAIEIINPTNTDISFTSITGDVLINDIAISTLNYQIPTTILANSSKTINISIKINPFEFARFTASRLLPKSNRDKIETIKFVANISGEGLNIPLVLQQDLIQKPATKTA